MSRFEYEVNLVDTDKWRSDLIETCQVASHGLATSKMSSSGLFESTV